MPTQSLFHSAWKLLFFDCSIIIAHSFTESKSFFYFFESLKVLHGKHPCLHCSLAWNGRRQTCRQTKRGPRIGAPLLVSLFPVPDIRSKKTSLSAEPWWQRLNTDIRLRNRPLPESKAQKLPVQSVKTTGSPYHYRSGMYAAFPLPALPFHPAEDRRKVSADRKNQPPARRFHGKSHSNIPADW